MALFKRTNLKDKGLTDEQIEYVMTESGRALGDYELKSNIQAKIDEAVSAVKPAEVNVLESSEYLSLMAENEKLKAFGTDDFLRMFGRVAHHRKAVFLYAGDKGTPLRTETAWDGGFVRGVDDGAAAYGLSSRTVGNDDSCRSAVFGEQYVCGHAAVKEIHVAVD